MTSNKNTKEYFAVHFDCRSWSITKSPKINFAKYNTNDFEEIANITDIRAYEYLTFIYTKEELEKIDEILR